MIVLLLIVSVAALISLWYILRLHKINKHNERQLVIYQRLSTLLTQEAYTTDTPMDELVIILNALRDTFNEKLKGKNKTTLKLPPLSIKDLKKTMEDKHGKETS